MNQNYIKSEYFFDKSIDLIPIYQGCHQYCSINGCNKRCLSVVGQLDKYKKYTLRIEILNCSKRVWDYIDKIRKNDFVEVSIEDILTNVDYKQASFGSHTTDTNEKELEFFKNLFICLRSST